MLKTIINPLGFRSTISGFIKVPVIAFSKVFEGKTLEDLHDSLSDKPALSVSVAFTEENPILGDITYHITYKLEDDKVLFSGSFKELTDGQFRGLKWSEEHSIEEIIAYVDQNAEYVNQVASDQATKH